MEIRDLNILMFEKTMNLGGSSKVVIQMCEILKPLVNKIVVCSTGGINVDYLSEMGIRHYKIKDVSNISNAFSNICKLSNIIRKEKINVVHTHHRMAALYTQILRRIHNIDFVASVHNEFFDKRLLTHYVYNGASIIACGDNVKRNLIDTYNVKSEQIYTIRNAIKRSNKYAELGTLRELRCQGLFLFCYVGRLTEVKGLEYLIRALAIIKSKYNQYRLIIVGEGYYKDKLLYLAKQLGVDNYIVFLGYREDVQNIIKQIDVVILPSLTEGLPLTPMEAYACGRTVIATDVGGNKELIIDKVDGLLVKPRDPRELAVCMSKLMNDDELRMNLSKNAAQAYDSKFSYSIFKEKLITFYTNLYSKV